MGACLLKRSALACLYFISENKMRNFATGWFFISPQLWEVAIFWWFLTSKYMTKTRETEFVNQSIRDFFHLLGKVGGSTKPCIPSHLPSPLTLPTTHAPFPTIFMIFLINIYLTDILSVLPKNCNFTVSNSVYFCFCIFVSILSCSDFISFWLIICIKAPINGSLTFAPLPAPGPWSFSGVFTPSELDTYLQLILHSTFSPNTNVILIFISSSQNSMITGLCIIFKGMK